MRPLTFGLLATLFWIVGATVANRVVGMVFLVLSGAIGYGAFDLYLYGKEGNDPS